MLFKHFNQRFTTRNNSSHTQNSQKKSQQTQTTRVVYANGRMYRTIQIKTSPKKKGSKKKYSNCSLFDKASKTIESITPMSSKGFIRPISQRSKKNKTTNSASNQLQKFMKTPLAKYCHNLEKKQENLSIHDTVFTKCMNYVKELESSSRQEPYKSCDNTVDRKREKMILQLNKQSTELRHDKRSQDNRNRNKKDNMILGDLGTVKPVTQLQRFGRLALKSRADRQIFRIELNNNNENYKENEHFSIKKILQKQKERQKQKQLFDQQQIKYTQDERKAPQIERLPLKVELKLEDFQMERQKSKPLKKQSLKLNRKQQEKIVQKQEKYQQKQRKLNVSFHIEPQTNNQNLRKSNVAIQKQPLVFSIKKQFAKQKSNEKKQEPKRRYSIESIQQIKLQKKQQDIIFQSSQRSEQQKSTQKSTIKPMTSNFMSQSKHNKQQSIKSKKQNKQTTASLKQKNQQIRPVGEIIGHGLKMLKGVNINWILPCIPVYKIFYQIRVQIQQLAEKFEVQDQFISKNRYENQRIQQSYKNMIKAAQKKPLTPQQKLQIQNSKISDSVTLNEIIVQIEKYYKVIDTTQLKSQQKSLLKVHFAMLINSALVLAHYFKKLPILQKIQQEDQVIDSEIRKGIKLIRSIK